SKSDITEDVRRASHEFTAGRWTGIPIRGRVDDRAHFRSRGYGRARSGRHDPPHAAPTAFSPGSSRLASTRGREAWPSHRPGLAAHTRAPPFGGRQRVATPEQEEPPCSHALAGPATAPRPRGQADPMASRGLHHFRCRKGATHAPDDLGRADGGRAVAGG